jgi:molybdopterin-guanine dinucleotide biosynthesis protein A
MGRADKALLTLGGRPLIAHVLDRLEPQVEAVLISANGDPARFAGFGCQVVPDARPQGPLSGVLAALQAAKGMGATHLVSTPVDTPFLPGDLVPQLLMAAEGAGGLAFAADATGDHPATALWPVGLAPALEAFLAAGVWDSRSCQSSCGDPPGCLRLVSGRWSGSTRCWPAGSICC